MVDFISCVFLFIFEWINYFEIFLFFDLILEFLSEWRFFWFGDMDYCEIVKMVIK